MRNRHGIQVLGRRKPKLNILQLTSTKGCSCASLQLRAFGCEYCGIYEAAKTRCNKCEIGEILK